MLGMLLQIVSTYTNVFTYMKYGLRLKSTCADVCIGQKRTLLFKVQRLFAFPNGTLV